VTQDVLTFAAQHTEEGKKVALITVTATAGSSPATAGSLMAVLPDGSHVGTVGGGASEFRVVNQAVEAIRNGDTIFQFAFDHAENGMVCGGSMSGFGNVLGSRPNLYIFGGGHIAQHLARIAILTGFSVTVVEDRPEFETYFDSVRYVVCTPENYETNDVVSGAEYAVICTRGHKTDDAALRYCLTKELKYLGTIGSAKKVAGLVTALREEGVPQSALEHVYSPIGLDIASAIPSEIAVAILAEILLVKNGGSLRHKKLLRSADCKE